MGERSNHLFNFAVELYRYVLNSVRLSESALVLGRELRSHAGASAEDLRSRFPVASHRRRCHISDVLSYPATMTRSGFRVSRCVRSFAQLCGGVRDAARKLDLKLDVAVLLNRATSGNEISPNDDCLPVLTKTKTLRHHRIMLYLFGCFSAITHTKTDFPCLRSTHFLRATLV